MNFFFWFFFVGFFIALLQDLKRREVDNWLNLFLFFSGFIFILSEVFRYGEISFLINFSVLALAMFFIAYIFYFSRIFAGGDCKLLFATTPLLVSFNFVNSFHNILFFCLAMLFIGAIYGLFWIVGLFFKNLRKNLIDLRNLIKKNYYIFIGVCFLFVLTFFDKFFIGVGFIFLFSYLLFLISKVIEKNSLTREIYTKELREGDWLEKDIKFRGRLIKSSFEGISLGEIEFLKNYKNKITIKDGIPYAPVFLFTWILFYFRGIIEDLIFGLIG